MAKQDYRGWVIDKGEWGKFLSSQNYVTYMTLQGASWVAEAEYEIISSWVQVFKFSTPISPLDDP